MVQQQSQSTAWGGQSNVTLFARNKGIPPSVEKVLLKLNKAFRGFPPFLLTDLGRMVEPPVTKGFKALPPGVHKKVGVVGAGLSGLIAALELVKLGYEVDIYEATDFIGGRLGAKPSDDSPSGFWEHGLHHFFHNVYDYLMQKIEEVGADRYFEPVDEVLLEFENYEPEVLEAKPNAHLLNMLGIVWRSPNVTMWDAIKSAPGMIPLFFYNHESVFQKFDSLTMVEYSQGKIAKPFFDTFIKTVLTVSLNRTEDISAAQALHLMWTFFIRKPDAMLRVVPTDNHYTSIMQPFGDRLAELGVKIHLGYRVNSLKLDNHRVTGLDFTNEESADLDYLVLATDIRGTKEIFAATEQEEPQTTATLEPVRAIVNKLRTAPPYVVARAYLLGKPENPDRPDVIETPENQPVDLVFQAHKTEKSDTTWVKAAPAGEDRWVIEVHAYDLGPTLARKYDGLKEKVKNCSDEELWQLILQLSDAELWNAIKEELRDIDGLSKLADATPVEDGGLQIGRYFNFTGFQVGQGDRPAPFFAEPHITNLVVAGDWVALQGKDGFANRPGQVYPGGNLMGQSAAVAGIAVGIIAAQDNVVGPYVSVI
ncbi:FAD-dependent oxidoreductase [Waterburya agarophytonicola K14]|uniref:FAD-dependent oxidoreductase n=1 Tax=Waterburya agarophytonicola KI4 TaxID=2874699 RepID=A0A964FFA8_9CYAN|nr:FAD-dependent oxidoreductase [Waterburya agarophytonicola]MCC0175619.1 FAD-dependent oxidoreductase [Waterburya agarophytonicola KI4]